VREIILFGKTLTRGERKEQEKEKRLEKEIFVTCMGMKVRNVGNAGQLDTSDLNVHLRKMRKGETRSGRSERGRFGWEACPKYKNRMLFLRNW